MDPEEENKEPSFAKKAWEGSKKVVGRLIKKIPLSVKLWIILGIACFFAALLFVGILESIPYIIKDLLTGGNSTSSESSDETISSLTSDGIVYIDENGKYKYKVESLPKKILKILKEQKLDLEELGYSEEELDDDEEEEDELEDDDEIENQVSRRMLKKYIEAELKTTLLKTGQLGIDGNIIVKRASTSKDDNAFLLDYVSYKEFDEMLNANNKNILNKFSIDPETFELWIAVAQSTTTYYKNGISVKSEGGGYRKDVINYKNLVGNYGTPFMFLVNLHNITQDKEFMNEFLKLVVGEKNSEPMVLTYVDSMEKFTTTYEYTGTYDKVVSTVISGVTDIQYIEDYGVEAIYDESELGTYGLVNSQDVIKNSNVTAYTDQVSLEYDTVISESYMGQIYVTKANTWVKKVDKTISEMETIDGEIIGESVEDINSVRGPNYYRVDYTKENPVEMSVIKKIETINIIETIITTRSGAEFTVVDGNNDINIEDFINLIESYPKVEDNLISSSYLMISLLSEDENTQRLEKLMRYVFLLLTDIDYGVKKEDLDYLFSESYYTISGIYGNTLQEKVWYALRSAGYSEYATARSYGEFLLGIRI